MCLIQIGVVLIAVCAVAAGPATAEKPTGVVIAMALVQGTDLDEGPPLRSTNSGVWSASGAFSDAGAVTESLQLKFNTDFTNIDYSVVEESLTGDLGTITLRLWLDGFTVISDTQVRFEGRWAVASGTGTYTRLSGQGTVVTIVDFELAALGEPSNFSTLTGFANLVP